VGLPSARKYSQSHRDNLKVRHELVGVNGAEVPYEPLPESRQRIMEDLDYQIWLPCGQLVLWKRV